MFVTKSVFAAYHNVNRLRIRVNILSKSVILFRFSQIINLSYIISLSYI